MGDRDDLPLFGTFFTQAYRQQDRMFEKLTVRVGMITPLLLKVEEILVCSRTRQAERLGSYYHHWEMKLFNAIGACTSTKLPGITKCAIVVIETLTSLLQM